MTRSTCSRCGVLTVPSPGAVCGPCRQADKAAEDKLRKDLFKP